MCGYVRRHVGPKTLREFLDLLGYRGDIDEPEDKVKHFYPAWGGNTNKTIEGLLIQEDGELKLVDATWWYHGEEINGELVLREKKTFNARNLHLSFWHDAIESHRAIVIATGIGEGKRVDGRNKHFLVTSERLMLLGAVYQKFPNGKHTCAIITRDEHPRFEPYHDKSFPLFLPYSVDFLKLWLSKVSRKHPQIAQLLASPRIFSNLTITPVKTFIGEVPTGPTEYVAAD